MFWQNSAELIALISVFILLFPASSSTPHCPQDLQGRKVRLIYEFPKPSWLENIAIRRNGSILVTELSQPRLYQIDPFSKDQKPWLVHSFSGYLGALGIAEIDEDVFAVITGNFSLAIPASLPGTYSAWKVDLRDLPAKGSSRLRVTKLTDFPQANFLNGMAYLPRPSNSLLIADSDRGLVYRYNLTSNTTDIAIDSLLMKKCSPNLLEGINGLRIHNSDMYFSNAYCGNFCRLPINTDGTARDGSPGHIIARTSSEQYIFDDMAVSSDGTAYLATGTENVITQVALNGVARVIAGDLNSSAIVEPTSLAFGRTKRDRNTLYITTGGGLGGLLNGTTLLGAQLVAVDL